MYSYRGARGLLLTLSRGIGAGVIAGEGRVYDAVRDRVCRHTGAFFFRLGCIRDGQRTGSVAAVHVRVPTLCIALRRRMYCTCYTYIFSRCHLFRCRSEARSMGIDRPRMHCMHAWRIEWEELIMAVKHA